MIPKLIDVHTSIDVLHIKKIFSVYILCTCMDMTRRKFLLISQKQNMNEYIQCINFHVVGVVTTPLKCRALNSPTISLTLLPSTKKIQAPTNNTAFSMNI